MAASKKSDPDQKGWQLLLSVLAGKRRPSVEALLPGKLRRPSTDKAPITSLLRRLSTDKATTSEDNNNADLSRADSMDFDIGDSVALTQNRLATMDSQRDRLPVKIMDADEAAGKQQVTESRQDHERVRAVRRISARIAALPEPEQVILSHLIGANLHGSFSSDGGSINEGDIENFMLDDSVALARERLGQMDNLLASFTSSNYPDGIGEEILGIDDSLALAKNRLGRSFDNLFASFTSNTNPEDNNMEEVLDIGDSVALARNRLGRMDRLLVSFSSKDLTSSFISTHLDTLPEPESEDLED